MFGVFGARSQPKDLDLLQSPYPLSSNFFCIKKNLYSDLKLSSNQPLKPCTRIHGNVCTFPKESQTPSPTSVQQPKSGRLIPFTIQTKQPPCMLSTSHNPIPSSNTLCRNPSIIHKEPFSLLQYTTPTQPKPMLYSYNPSRTSPIPDPTMTKPNMSFKT